MEALRCICISQFFVLLLRIYMEIIEDMYVWKGHNKCENYLWRDMWVTSDHKFASRVDPTPLYLFAHIQEELPLCMLLVDAIELVDVWMQNLRDGGRL